MTTPWYAPSNNRPRWYFDRSDDPWAKPTVGKDDWAPYNDIYSNIIERAYIKKQHKVEIDGYELDLDNMVQISNEDANKQRRICRELCHSAEAERGTSRFGEAERPISKTFTTSDIRQCAFIDEWVQKNPHYTFKSETIEQIAAGIEKEGKIMTPSRTIEAREVADQLRAVKNKPLNEIMYFCVFLYTQQCFLYELINTVMRENDKRKIDTLAPFCCLLRNYLHEDQDSIYPRVYRAVNLTHEMIQEYKDVEGQIRSWRAFSSTTQDKEEAMSFQKNTLFVIDFRDDTSPCYPGRDISSLSMYSLEKEVLLHPGVDFRVDKVEEAKHPEEMTVIHLSLM